MGLFDLDLHTKNWGSRTITRPQSMSMADWMNGGWQSSANSAGGAKTLGDVFQSVRPAAQQQQQPGGMLQDLLMQFQKSQAESKKANEGRYQQILRGYQQRNDRVMRQAEKFGAAEQEAIQRGLTEQLAANQQSAISRGLGNTTVLDALNRGSQMDAGYQRRQLAGQLANLRANLDQSATGEMLAFQERRNDIGPDLGQMISLMSMYGNAGGGYAQR